MLIKSCVIRDASSCSETRKSYDGGGKGDTEVNMSINYFRLLISPLILSSNYWRGVGVLL